MYVVRHRSGTLYARFDSAGEHDRRQTDDLGAAKVFVTHGEASDFAQNFSADWGVHDVYDDFDDDYWDWDDVA